MTNSLSDTTMLVDLTINEWHGYRIDRCETDAVAQKHGTRKGAARVNKTLLPNCPELRAVKNAGAALRRAVANRSLPWASGGQRIIPAKIYFEFQMEMNEHINEWRDAVNEFLEAYPAARANAAFDLNTMFNADEYPEVEDLRRRFDCRLVLLPVPTAEDFRLSLVAQDMDKLRKELEAENQRRLKDSVQDIYDRLQGIVKRTFEKLSDPKAIFRDSLIHNVEELTEILPTLNLTDDPTIATATQKLRNAVCMDNVDTLRRDKSVRSNAAQELSDIMDMIGPFCKA